MKLPVHSDGAGSDTLFFIHGNVPLMILPVFFICVPGWPDNAEMWDPQVEVFKDSYRCLRVTMPHYAGRARANDLGARRSGYSFSEAADLLKVAVEENNNGEPVVLVIHDWGCYWGFVFQMKYPGLVKAIVALDVGHPSQLKAKTSVIVVTLLGLWYWFYLAVAFLIGGSVGDGMVKFMVRRGFPLRHPQHEQVLARITADLGYPYTAAINLTWSLFFGGSKNFRKMCKPVANSPSCPCLYMYGRKKPLQFHDPAWVAALRKRDDCDAVGVNSGHWISLEATEEFNQRVEEWLLKILN